MRFLLSIALSFSAVLVAETPAWDRAHELYQRTEYKQSLAILLPLKDKDAATLQLIGQAYFMQGEYKKASETFEKALAITPRSSQIYEWLGRSYGRRAETASIFSAPGLASKTRQMFEMAVQLDPKNQDALDDLFDYYLEAPGFLGGGIPKAEDVAKHIAKLDEAQGHYVQAQLNDKRKEYQAAEEQLRRAVELAPREANRLVDLAKYLAKRGRVKESDAMFAQAANVAPNNPKVLFERADAYISEQRNLNDARQLLERYLAIQLTPDDPPRERAQELLKKIDR
jgi:tetratricopeptide (TPR) repeat protein